MGIYTPPIDICIDNLKIYDNFKLNLRIRYYLCFLNAYATLKCISH